MEAPLQRLLAPVPPSGRIARVDTYYWPFLQSDAEFYAAVASVPLP